MLDVGQCKAPLFREFVKQPSINCFLEDSGSS